MMTTVYQVAPRPSPGRIWQLKLALVLTGFVLLLAGCSQEEPVVPTLNERGYMEALTIGMSMQWKIENSTIEIILTAPTTGWVAVGFDPINAMRGANFILAYVKNGQVFVADHFGTELIEHASDESLGGTSDVTALGGSETGGTTEISLSIPLDSGDEYDRPLAKGREHTILLAFGEDDDFVTEHDKKLSKKFKAQL